MKKQLCSLALSAIFGLGVAIAAPQTQDPAAPPPAPGSADSGQRSAGHRPFDPNRQLQMLSKRLQLTSDQQNQILPILTSRGQQVESLRSDTSLSPKDRRFKMRSIREEGDAQIKAVLSDSQKKAYDQLREQMREREQQRREEHQNGGSLLN